MRLLQVNSVYGYGSTGRIVKDIHNAALTTGIDSFVAYGRGNHSGERFIKIGNKKDLIYHGLKTRFFDQHGLASKSATRELIKQIDFLNPDIIHLHNIHGYYLNYPIFFDYLKSIKKRIVWTLHDCWAYTGHCSYYTFENCNKWESHCNECPQVKNYPKSFIIDHSYENFDKKRDSFGNIDNMIIVTPSTWLNNELKKSILKNYLVKVINNGIDISVFKETVSNFKSNYGIQGKKIILGVANKWEDRKGIQFFIKLKELLRKDEVIVLVGTKQKKDLDGIITISRTNNTKELAEIYSSSDVLLNPTLEDNYPTVNLEAIACGTPVVVNDVGGTKETVINGFGIVINDYDPSVAIKLIREKVFNNADLMNKFKTINFDEITYNKMTNSYIDLYRG